MSHNAFDAKDRVRSAIDIVELVGSYFPLRREGRIYKCLCPWHNDSRPSLQVNPDRQSWKCWVCDDGGDVFNFIMKIENVPFPEALKMLAERAGVQLDPVKSSGGASSGDEKQLFYQAAAWVEKTYHEFLLKSPEAEGARKYLRERGITEDSIKRFHVGYAPDKWEWLAEKARGTPFSPKVLNTIGVLGQRQNQPGFYDRFKGRVLFSIRDLQGRPVALGGRVLPPAPADVAKYVNSPETPLFSKSSMLYGLDQARDAITQLGKEGQVRTAVVMEGYTDALIAQQCGFHNAVAVLGTALGEKHVRLLKRFADKIILVLDGDEAGQKRTNEVLDLFVAEQVDLRILTLPEEFDPCDFLLRRGAEPFRALLETATDALEHKVRVATKGIDLSRDTHRANQALEAILETLAKAPRNSVGESGPGQLREQQMLARLAREFRVPEESLRQRMKALRRGARRPEVAAGEQPINESAARGPLDPWERELLEIVLVEPESVSTIVEQLPLELLNHPLSRKILAKCAELSAAGITPSFERLLLEFDDGEVKSLLVDIDETAQAKGGVELALRLKDVLTNFRWRSEDGQRRALVAKLRDQDGTSDKVKMSLDEIIAKQRSRQGISAPTDG